LGLYNVGKGIYDFGRGVLGYDKPATTMRYDFDGNIADARSGSYSTNPGIGFSNRDLEDYDPNIGMDDEEGLSATDVESFDREAASEQSDGGANDPGDYGGDDDE
jgi:hypothetical protein